LYSLAGAGKEVGVLGDCLVRGRLDG
jgi:hypothetical protein